MYGWFDMNLGRLRPERLTSKSNKEALPGGTSSPSISPRPQWAEPIFPPDHPSALRGYNVTHVPNGFTHNARAIHLMIMHLSNS